MEAQKSEILWKNVILYTFIFTLFTQTTSDYIYFKPLPKLILEKTVFAMVYNLVGKRLLSCNLNTVVFFGKPPIFSGE